MYRKSLNYILKYMVITNLIIEHFLNAIKYQNIWKYGPPDQLKFSKIRIWIKGKMVLSILGKSACIVFIYLLWVMTMVFFINQ